MSIFGDLSGAASGAVAGSAGGPIGAAVGGGIGLLTSIFGGGANSPQATANNAILKNVPNQINTGNAATQTGLADLGNAGRFYNTVLGGNKDAISSLLNPQVSTVLGQYDNAAKSVAQFAPRGGGTTQTLAQLPFQKATATQGVLNSALPGAAAGATGVGGSTAGVGTSLLGQATGASSSLNNYQTQANQLSATQNSALGGGLGKIFANLLQKKGTGSGSGGWVDTADD